MSTCLSAGLVPALQGLLSGGQAAPPASLAAVGASSEEERLECLWVVSLVAYAGREAAVAMLACAPFAVGLLSGASQLLAEHAAYALGNFAAYGGEVAEALRA